MSELVDRLPCIPKSDLRNGRLRYAEPGGQTCRSFPVSSENPDFSHLAISEFRLGVIRSSRRRLSALSNHVRHVVGVCAKKEMAGVDADGVVTAMANEHPFWDRSIVKDPAHAVSEATNSGRKCPDLALAVSPPGRLPLPSPAAGLAIVAINARKELINFRLRYSGHVNFLDRLAVPRDVTSIASAVRCLHCTAYQPDFADFARN